MGRSVKGLLGTAVPQIGKIVGPANPSFTVATTSSWHSMGEIGPLSILTRRRWPNAGGETRRGFSPLALLPAPDDGAKSLPTHDATSAIHE